MGPKGFDPLACGSEDRRDILATLRAHASVELVNPYINKSYNCVSIAKLSHI